MIFFVESLSRSFTMSRRPRYASSHSRGSSPRRDSSLPVTEATYQDLHLNKTSSSNSIISHHHHHHLTVPSSYQASNSRQRQASYPPTDLTAHYLPAGYEPSQYSRPPSSERLIDPRHISAISSFGIVDPDPLNFPIEPSSAAFNGQPDLSDPTLLARAEMR